MINLQVVQQEAYRGGAANWIQRYRFKHLATDMYLSVEGVRRDGLREMPKATTPPATLNISLIFLIIKETYALLHKMFLCFFHCQLLQFN